MYFARGDHIETKKQNDLSHRLVEDMIIPRYLHKQLKVDHRYK